MKNIEFYERELKSCAIEGQVVSFQIGRKTMSFSDISTFINWLKEEHQILDKTEKRYLGNIIRPLKTKYTTVEKRRWGCNEETEYEYICINHLVDYSIEERLIFLPTFKAGTMYKGMKVDKKYTLEELGL